MEVIARFSNLRVNPTLTHILTLDQEIFQYQGQTAFDTRQGPRGVSARRRRYLKPTDYEAIEREYMAGATLNGQVLSAL